MFTHTDALKQINSISRPTGYNSYAWNVTKKIAQEAWDCYLEGKKFKRPVNYLCKEFYLMIKTPDGHSIVPENKIRRY